jgi:hypothetical protein
MDLTAVAIVAGIADIANTGRVAVALSLFPLSTLHKKFLSMQYNAMHDYQ